ncbi:MAG: hypothetical protein IH851_13800 [Armatimonadetes bacterium]|nr:hypothetical protein [Armatimonadota bacterium]
MAGPRTDSEAAAERCRECPVCGAETVRRFREGPHDIQVCRRCTLEFWPTDLPPAALSKLYDEPYFTQGGAGYPDYIGDGAPIANSCQ